MGRLSDLRTFASLSPRLLARKGGARPAMRSQLNALPISAPQGDELAQDDLGWNDMGAASGQANGGAEIAAPLPLADVIAINPAALLAALPQSAPDEFVPEAKTARRSAISQGRRAAFTLRLDADRHLKLRLASAVGDRSAQQLMIEALDRLISGVPDIESLAAQVKKRRSPN